MTSEKESQQSIVDSDQIRIRAATPQAKQEIFTAIPSDFWTCPKCGGLMLVIERLTAAELQLRSPPCSDALAA